MKDMNMPDIMITKELFERLQRHSEPLVDTIETTISKLIDFKESLQIKSEKVKAKDISPDMILCDPVIPPSLKHTKPTSINVDGVMFQKSDLYWNSLYLFLVRLGAETMTTEELSKIVIGNHLIGTKHDEGFKFVANAGLSVQGLDAVSAWRAVYYLAENLGINVCVNFYWQDKKEAAYPKKHGIIESGFKPSSAL